MAEPTHRLPIPQSLIQETQSLAQELNISWKLLITVALQDFIRRYHGRQELTNRINAAYAEPADDDDRLLQQMRSTHRKLVEGEW